MKQIQRLISIDIEASGPDPRAHGLVALGAAVYDKDETGAYCLREDLSKEWTVQAVSWDQNTLTRFWETNQEAYQHLLSQPQLTKKQFTEGLELHYETFGKDALYMAAPTAYDMSYLLSYLDTFFLPRRWLDIGSFVFGKEGDIHAYRRMRSEEMKQHHGIRHTALYDAIMQGNVAAKVMSY